MESLEPNKETMDMVEQVARREITAAEAIEAGKIKYTALGQGEHITLDEAMQKVKKGHCYAQAGMNDIVGFAFPPDGTVTIDKKTIREAIEYAIRSNALEGLKTSPETKKLLERVAVGEITFDQVRQIINQKAKQLSSKK